MYMMYYIYYNNYYIPHIHNGICINEVSYMDIQQIESSLLVSMMTNLLDKKRIKDYVVLKE